MDRKRALRIVIAASIVVAAARLAYARARLSMDVRFAAPVPIDFGLNEMVARDLTVSSYTSMHPSPTPGVPGPSMTVDVAPEYVGMVGVDGVVEGYYRSGWQELPRMAEQARDPKTDPVTRFALQEILAQKHSYLGDTEDCWLRDSCPPFNIIGLKVRGTVTALKRLAVEVPQVKSVGFFGGRFTAAGVEWGPGSGDG